jgi:hypothetical protein
MTFTLTAIAKLDSRPVLGTRSARFAYGCTKRNLNVTLCQKKKIIWKHSHRGQLPCGKFNFIVIICIRKNSCPDC